MNIRSKPLVVVSEDDSVGLLLAEFEEAYFARLEGV